MHGWLVVVSWIGVGLGVASSLLVLADILAGHAHRMWIMNVVWPITALWAGPLGAWAWWRWGRASKERQAFAVAVAKGTTHCGSGCTVGDIVAEVVFVALPFTLFGHRLFGAWVYEMVAAFVFGIAFQYFTIAPMRHERLAKGLEDALKADSLSLAAWQVGMFGWMALATFAFLHRELEPTSVVFWFMMQVGMFAGFATSYPVNWMLLRRGLKEAM